MRRILVYGVTGSGKSTLARRIGERLSVPYVSVDDLMWETGWVPVPAEGQRERIAPICASDAWVLDAAYGYWRDLVLPRVELIVGLDLPRWRSLGRLLRRTALRIATGASVCNGNRESVRGSLLTSDSIVRWHFQSFARKRATMRAWHADPAMPETVLLRTPAEVEEWLRGLR
ncbi:adenylate kinase [Jidongwangia harbinensis]|uniref:adenylate kinase n=1 Tax=Jidongwangia harbinensis TaxID=2878561 RepID=UPI001CD9D891|nr:adenylate kinase [Jidongwangia harbinensis]MCA2216490.1 adenylate kinase [Jidongwangia harbinensis]